MSAGEVVIWCVAIVCAAVLNIALGMLTAVYCHATKEGAEEKKNA